MTVSVFNGYVHAARTIPSGVTASVTTNAGGPTVVTLTPGSFRTVSLMLSSIMSDFDTQRPITGGSWQGGFELAGQNGLVTIQTSNASLFSITWVDTNLRDILGFAADIVAQTSATATKQARGFWRPDCPIYIEGGRYRSAPRVSDEHQTVSPNGFTISHVGNMKYRHKGVQWSKCPNHKIWIIDEGTTCESLEQFLLDTQWRQGISWFSTGAKKAITAHDGNLVGSGLNGWYWMGCRDMDAIVKRVSDWDGLWNVTIPKMETDS